MADTTKKDYLTEELLDVRREQSYGKKPFLQFSKIILGFLLLNILFIEIYSLRLMEEQKNLTSLYALIGLAGGETITGVIWYMKNSAAEKVALANKEIQLIKLIQSRIDGQPLGLEELTNEYINISGAPSAGASAPPVVRKSPMVDTRGNGL